MIFFFFKFQQRVAHQDDYLGFSHVTQLSGVDWGLRVTQLGGMEWIEE